MVNGMSIPKIFHDNLIVIIIKFSRYDRFKIFGYLEKNFKEQNQI